MSQLQPIRVVIIDRDRLFREFLRNFLRSASGITCGACLSSLPSLSSLSSFRFPDIPDAFLVHCHTEMLGELRSLSDRYGASKFVAIRVDVEQLDLVACIQAGIDGFVLSDADGSDVVSAIRCVGRGDKFLPSLVAETLFSQVRSRFDSKLSLPLSAISRLTAREEQIAKLILEGLSNKEIGRRLSIESSTVKTHVHSILKKLRVPTRTALVRCAGANVALHVNLDKTPELRRETFTA